MAGTASSSTELSAVASPAAGAATSAPDAFEYPERQWIAQSVWHGDAVGLAKAALRNRFRDREDVLAAMELVVYYERGNNAAWLQPDVLVAFGVGRGGNRSTYKVWEEGKPPDFVLEVASPSTAEHDARYKAGEYARMGVPEYWRLDPQGTLMGTALEGYALTGGRYEPVEVVDRPGGGGWLRSRVLGLDLGSRKRDGATVLVFADPRTGEEFDGALEQAEDRATAERDRADAAEDRVKAERNRADAERDRADAAEDRMTAERDRADAERDRADAERDRADAERDRADAAEDRVRALEERLRNRAGGVQPAG